ncbi:molybdate ABC transporter substrate-binding protein [Shewanella sp.]|uniref:molybdate ABC transporter substrate-binding protein n=1 Tax=Shewanella sp. TaxID=50422 RepID=UPI0025836873|nr:molybdate ABC transporter substrate-binding protein [Shewanella sp.]MCJ8304287.1 molybdate ABC transporter substrate-binding protein [Shewanella sp.]
MKSKQTWSFLKPAYTGLLLLAVSLPALATDKVVVFAAASLTNAMTEIGVNYDKTHQTKTLFSFASSSTLARQIAQGAPAHVYLSANQKWMDYLVDNHLVKSDSKVTLLSNSLVLIAPKATTSKITLNNEWDIGASLAGGRLAVGDPDHVPAGLYAKQALNHLGLWQQAEPQLARANSVRAALALVEHAEAPLGIVYATDAKLSDKVSAIATFPPESHKPIEYPLVLVNKRPSAAAVAFYRYLQTDDAKAVFNQYGFGVK